MDGTLPSGNRARVEVRLARYQMQRDGETIYSWSVSPCITQTSGNDLAAIYAHTQTAHSSRVYNPQWLAKTREMSARGYAANSQAIQRNHEAAMDNIAEWGRVNKANAAASMARIKENGEASRARQDQQAATYDKRMADNDRSHELFTDVVINGEAKYENAATGERVKADSRYNHTYTDNNGRYYQSNTPLKANDVNWQEMEKVPFDNY